MTDARQAWSEAGHQISALTARLRETYEQQRTADTARAEEAGGGGPGTFSTGEPTITDTVPGGASGPEPTVPGAGGSANGPTSGQTAGAGAGRAELQDAVKRLSDAAKDVFEALSGAAKDPNVKADVKQVGNSVSTAFAATFSEIADQVRKAQTKASERSRPGSSSASDTWAKAADDVPGGGTPPAESPPSDAPPSPPYGTPPGTPGAAGGPDAGGTEPPQAPPYGSGTPS